MARENGSGGDGSERSLSGRVTRVLLDWNQPALPSVVDWFFANHAGTDRLDLRRHLLVTPAFRARRRLLQLLAAGALQRGLLFLPGESITVGSLPERLYSPRLPLANDLNCRLAWQAALEATPARQLQGIAPSAGTWQAQGRRAFAAQLQQLHEMLGAEGVSLASIDKRGLAGDSGEKARWKALAELQGSYYGLLERNGLWDRHAARNVAVHHGECRCDRHVVLVGTADLNEITARMLEASGTSVTAICFGPPDGQAGFDPWGVLRPEWWRDRPIPVRREQLAIAFRPVDQAHAVTDCLDRLPPDLVTDELTVCAPDEDVAVHVTRRLEALGVPARRLAGKQLSLTRFGRLVDAVSAWLAEPGFDGLAAIARHPDLFAALSQALGHDQWLSALDEFQNRYLPSRVDQSMLARARRSMQQDRHGAAAACEPLIKLLDWLEPFGAGLVQANPAGHRKRRRGAVELNSPAPVVDQVGPAEAWRLFFGRVYGGEAPGSLPAGAAELEARRVAERFLEEVALLLSGSRPGTPAEAKFGSGLSALAAGELLAERLAEESAVDETAAGAVELAGWLDLALDDARAIIVTGVNDHNWPSRASGSPLLNDRLRERLALPGDDRRFARDAWTLGMVLHAREHVWLIAGRRDRDGSPLLPSRLLFAADPDTVRRRAGEFFAFRGDAAPRRWMTSHQAPAARQRLPVPPPVPVPPINRISVTRLREYLKCPYRFYLGMVLELEVQADDARELDGGIFGDLAHEVLEDFGNGEAANSPDAEEIAGFLAASLKRHSRRRLPFPAWPAARLQIANLGRRLDRFAELQAERRREGWQIVRVEPKVEGQVVVDGAPFTLVGRIDRVDRHDDGRLAIWDYKTSDAGTTADKAHRRAGDWIDFQLPVYRRLLARVLPEANGRPDETGLGYILLPRDLGEIRFDSAAWSVDELHEADDEVVNVLRRIRAGEFWPPAAEPPDFAEELAAICQDEVLERWDWRARG